MTARDVQIAFQAGFVSYELEDYTDGGYDVRYERFADLIRADEREACAKVCDELHWPWNMGDNSGPKECAEAIRARGNT